MDTLSPQSRSSMSGLITQVWRAALDWLAWYWDSLQFKEQHKQGPYTIIPTNLWWLLTGLFLYVTLSLWQ